MRVRLEVTGGLTAAVLFLAPCGSMLSAQAHSTRSGYWFGADGGYGRLDLTNCASCQPGGVPFAAVRLGGTIGNRFTLGFEAAYSPDGGAGLPATLSAMGRLAYYPLASSAAHVTIGGGALGRDAQSNVDGMLLLALVIGAGFDHRIAPGVSLVPSVSWVIAPGGYATNLLRAGLGITFH